MPIFPIYDQESSLIESFYKTLLHGPQIVLTFNPEAIAIFNSSGEIDRFNDTNIYLDTQRENSLVSTSGKIKSFDIFSVFQLPELEYSEISITNAEFDVRSDGIYMSAAVNTACESSEICRLVEDALENNTFTGIYYPVDFYIKQAGSDIWLDTVKLYENEIRIYMDLGNVQIKGKFDLQAAENDFISFDVNLTSSEENVGFI